jgi:hypothetical protein
MAGNGNLVQRRPAESSALVGAVVVLICALLGVDDPNVLAALTIVVGAIPAIVTWIVDLRSKKP